MNAAHRLSLAAVAAALLFASAVACAVLRPLEDIRPVARRSTACPPPAYREAADRATLLARLREAREKFQALHAGELTGADEAAGPANELDRMLMELIADLDTPEEPRP